MVQEAREKRKFIELSAFTTFDNVDVKVFAHIIEGARNGPMLYVGAATHGNELQGVEICRRLAQQVQSDALAGKLIVVPIQNPMAYRHRVRLNPVDGKDLDRLYPGSADGTATNRLAWTLYSELASQADCVVDLHSGGIGSMNVPHIYVPPRKPTRTQHTCLELAKAFGGDVLIDTQPGVDYHFDLDHPSPYYCNTQGAAGLYPELGEGGRVDEYYVDFGLRGVKNVLRKLGMLEGSVERQGKQKVVTRTAVVLAKTSGILIRKYELGQEVKKGDLMAKVVGVFNGYEEIFAPADGLVQWTVTFGNVCAGEHICWIGEN